MTMSGMDWHIVQLIKMEINYGRWLDGCQVDNVRSMKSIGRNHEIKTIQNSK